MNAIYWNWDIFQLAGDELELILCELHFYVTWIGTANELTWSWSILYSSINKKN